MQPTKIPISDSSSDADGTDDAGVAADKTFQSIVISPTTGALQPDMAATSPAPVTNPASEATSPSVALGASATQVSIPAVQSMDPSSATQPEAAITSAGPSDFQSQPQVKPSPVPSLTVPQRGSFSAPVAEQPAAQAMPPLPTSPALVAPLSQPAVPDPMAADLAQPTVVASGLPPTPTRSRKKLYLVLGGGLVAVLALLAAGVFGWYLPNTPTNVYGTGLARSGKALDALVVAATTEKQLKSYATSTIKGTMNVKSEEGNFTGDFNTTFDKTTQNGGLNVSLKQKGATEQKYSLKALSKIPEGSSYPDVYLQLTGIKALGVDAFAPGISDYDGKWISISSSYIESIAGAYGAASGTEDGKEQPQVTAADVAEVTKTVMAVTQDYVFTDDPTKAVLVKKEYVGKETMDGMNTYHYKMGLNSDHAKDYCVALGNAVLSTDAAKKFADDSTQAIAELKKTVAKNCENEVKDAAKDSDSFDMWIDTKYKLIHQIRVYDKEDTKSYLDVGQTYLGGDKLSFFVKTHSEKDKMDGTVTIDTDIHAAKTSGTITIVSKGDASFEATIKLSAEASSGDVPFTKPKDVVPIQDILKRFGIDPGTSTVSPYSQASAGSLQAEVADAARQDDINTIRSFVETFYTAKDRYPTLAEMNSATWRTANLKGFDNGALQPPDSTTTTLAAKATATQYAYVPGDCGANGCQSYTVSALLSTGQAYQKQNISASTSRAT